MEYDSIAQLRRLASAGSEDALLILIDRFSPLFKKYARKFDYEDTYSELQLYFIALIQKFPAHAQNWNDGQTVAYLAKSIRTAYIKLSQQNNFRENKLLEFNPDIMDRPDEQNTEQTIFLQEILTLLNDSQKEILFLHYIEGYSIQEIAKLQGKSRQAINKTKNQALNILKKQLNS